MYTSTTKIPGPKKKHTIRISIEVTMVAESPKSKISTVRQGASFLCELFTSVPPRSTRLIIIDGQVRVCSRKGSVCKLEWSMCTRPPKVCSP